MNFLIDLDDKIFIAKAETSQLLEDWAQDEMTNNYDVIDSSVGFSKAYPQGELEILYANQTGEVEFIDYDFTESARNDVANKLLSVIVRDSEIPIIEENGGLPMAASKKAAVKRKAATKKKAAPKKKAAATKTATTGGKTRAGLSDTQKVKKGIAPKSDTSVRGAIWASVTKQMTSTEIAEGLIATGYTPPRRDEPADLGYLKGYISSMIRDGELVKV